MMTLLPRHKEKKHILQNTILLLLLQTTILAFSQTNNPSSEIIPPSPTVASMKKFGDYPISYNTGTVGISTELFVFSLGKGLNLDICLNYHPSGVKVEDISGRVGTGWTLFAGGCISRQVRGYKDEASGSGFYNFIKKRKGYSFPDISQPSFAMTADSIAKNILDPSPDIFSLNLLGRNYKFFLGKDCEFYTIPYSNIKVNKHPLASDGGGTWEIIDESGIRYIFGIAEGIIPGSTSRIGTFDSAWWLTSIISAEGNVLASFEYRGSNPVYSDVGRRTLTFKAFEYPYSYPSGMGNTHIGDKTHSGANQYSAWDLYKINITGKGSIVFESGTSIQDQAWKLISEIKCYDNKNVLMDKYLLSYTHSSNRPFLSEILKTSSGGTTIKYRTFTYYPGLPSQYSKSQDSWGYYNGATNTTLYPFVGSLSNYSYTSADRYPTDKAIAGTIKEIIYPTGGKTFFEFENNKIYGQENVYTTNKELFSHRQSDYGESISTDFSTTAQKINMQIEMSIHPAGLYSVDIRLVRADNNSTVIQYTNTSVPGNGFVNMGTNPDGTQRFVCTISDYSIQSGTYKWVTKIISDDDRPNRPKPSPIIISNTFYKVITNTETREKLVGGLRIARISNYNSDGQLEGKTHYTYLSNNGICSGVGAPAPEFVRSYVITENVCPACAIPKYSDMGLIEIGEIDLNQYNGSAVQYLSVTEERTGEGLSSFKTDYEYRKREFERTSIPYPGWLISRNYSPYSLNEYEEGLLISKTDYECRNNVYTPIRKEYNTYTLLTQGRDIPVFTAVSLDKHYMQPEISPNVLGQQLPHYAKYHIGTYDFKSAKIYLASSKTEEITQNGTITNTTDYFYDNTTYHQLTRSKQIGSNGVVREIAYKYCYDDNTVVSDKMKYRNILTPALHTTSKVDNKQIRQTEVIFEEFLGNIIEPKIIREQTTPSTIHLEIIYHNYDKYGNPLYLSKNGTEQIVYLWSYSGQYPIAEIKNTTLTEVNAVMSSVFGVTNADALSVLIMPDETKLKDGSLQRALPNAIVTTYTYKPLIGMQTATSPNGITSFYEYDSFGRLQFLKDYSEKIIEQYYYNYRNK